MLSPQGCDRVTYKLLFFNIVTISKRVTFSASLFSLQGSRDYFGPALLRGHRHVVTGLCDFRALSGLAPLPWSAGVRPGKVLHTTLATELHTGLEER